MPLKLFSQTWLLVCAFSFIVWSVRIGQIGSRMTTGSITTLFVLFMEANVSKILVSQNLDLISAIFSHYKF